ncbi:hypothetical protein MHYP_G00091670 [Metynnis hypsauchen]
MSEERELLLSSYYLKKSFFHSDEKILERWRQEESLRQLRKEVERDELKRKKKEKSRKLDERRRERERERRKEMEMIQWRLQALMERQRVDREERQELQRLRELERELQLKELREREEERERQETARKMALLSQDDLNDLKNTTQPEPASSCTAEEQNVQLVNNVKAAYRSYMETVRKPRMEVFENTRRSLDEIERKLKDLQKMILDGDASKLMLGNTQIQKKLREVKEKYQKAIDKSIKWEEEYGDKLLLIRSIKSNKVVTVAENERAKRERLQEKEEKRQTLENKWRQWQQKRAEKKAKKEEKKQELEAKRRECEEKRAKKKAD